MATAGPEAGLPGVTDPQRPVAFVVGGVLAVTGVAGLSGHLEGDLVVITPLSGIFGVPFWLGVTMIVAGGLGLLIAAYGSGAPTFNRVAAGLVLPAALCLAITDWSLGVGTAWALGIGLLSLTVAVLVVALSTILLWGHPVALVFPLVALLAVTDWVGSITAVVPAASVTGPTIGLILVLAIGMGAIGFTSRTELALRTTP